MMRFLKKSVSAAKDFWSLVLRARSHTYYLEQKRKSRLRIFFEMLWWAVRKREINYYFYLQGFDCIHGIDHRDYFAMPEFMKLRDQANSAVWIGGRKTSYSCLLQDKFLFSQYLKSLDFETPETLAVCNDGSVMWHPSGPTETFNEIYHHNGLDAFLKPTVGWQGENIFNVAVKENKLYLDGRQIHIEDAKSLMKGKYVIQARIHQHHLMQQLHPESVNSLRIVTARTNGESIVLSSVLRIGANGGRCDNWSGGGICVGIDSATGTLGKYGYFNPKFGRKVSSHPNTNIPFKGYKIPFYEQCVKSARKLHFFFYGLHSIGWDIAITENGPVFIEGNDDWGIRVIQSHDPGFKRRFLATLV